MLYSDFITKSVTNFETITGEGRFRGETVLKYSISCPKVEINQRMSSKDYINRTYFQLTQNTKRYIINNYYARAATLYSNMDPQEFCPLEIMCEMTVMYENRGFLSLFFDTYEKLGDTVLKSSRKSDTWGLRCGKVLPLGSFFVMGYNYRKVIEGEIIRDIEKEIALDERRYFSDWRQGIKRHLNMQNYYLADDGLVIYFPEYSIAPKTSGLPSFLVPYPIFGSNLKYDL